MPKPRILIADHSNSDASALSVVRRYRRWTVHDVDDPRAASGEWDILVATEDAEGRGTEFLRQQRHAGSSAARILVCDKTVAVSTLARGEPAHQVVVRPVSGDKLVAAIKRSLRVAELVRSPKLAAVAAELGTLPAMPKTWMALNDLLGSGHATLDDAVAVVEQDVGVASQVLRLVNSGMFGGHRKLANLFDALQLLGLNLVRDLVLSVELTATLYHEPLPRDISPVGLDRLAHTIAVTARLVAPRAAVDTAFTAGLLHVLGRLIFAHSAPLQFRSVVEEVWKGQSVVDAEREVFGVDSRALSAWLLAQWGLPHEVVEAVLWCDTPSRARGRGAPLALSVFVAIRLVEEAAVLELTGDFEPRLFPEELVPWGLAEQLGPWREQARELLEATKPPPLENAAAG
ncbi:MAG: HDOD domain-containing protein [Myxococcales bacterium]|nr:HDOD domain-containing protein [Myxococcales bacterium]